MRFNRREFRSPVAGLDFDDADGLPFRTQDMVGWPNIGLILPYGYAKTSIEVESVLVLHRPTRRQESTVDSVATCSGFLLRSGDTK